LVHIPRPPTLISRRPWVSKPAPGRRRDGLEALDDGAGAEATAAAHAHEADVAVDALELVERLGHEDGARAAQRVTQGDGAAVDVGALDVGAELTLPGQHHRGERLVDLEQVDVADAHAGAG